VRGNTFYHNTLGIILSPTTCHEKWKIYFNPHAAAATGARTPLYCALAPEARGNTFYHNTLGIIPSSNASYDVTRMVPQYDAALKMMHAHKGMGTGSAQVAGQGRKYSTAAGSGNGKGRSTR
jgi:predicted Zn-dependent protease